MKINRNVDRDPMKPVRWLDFGSPFIYENRVYIKGRFACSGINEPSPQGYTFCFNPKSGTVRFIQDAEEVSVVRGEINIWRKIE